MKTLFLLLALSCSQLAFGAKPLCSAAEVEGTYALLANGFVLVPGSPISGPFMRIGLLTADGKGAITVSTLAIYNGINFGQEHFAGTYTVTSDCAVDFIANVPAPVNLPTEFKGQVADGGNEFTFMLTNFVNPISPAPTTVLATAKKQPFKKSCAATNLEGSWQMDLTGYRILAVPNATATPWRQLGQVEADGSGGLTASFVTSDNGDVARFAATGTYTVSADCTFNLNLGYLVGGPAGPPYSVRGTLADENNGFVSLNLAGPPIPGLGGPTFSGAVATGSMLRETRKPSDSERN